EPELAQSERLVFRTLVRQRIDARDRVTQNAVRVDETVDPRLQWAFSNFARRGGYSRAVALRQVAQLKTLEERRPIRIDRARIVQPALVILIEQIEVQKKFAIARTQSPARETHALPRWFGPLAMLAILPSLLVARLSFAQADPASEPAVLAIAKVLPAVVNINAERIVRRTVRDPLEDLYAQFFGYNHVRPRQIRQTLQSLGSGFIIDPAGYIVTNQHVVER